jgi:uncharacterized protein YcbK (DUF882 family)
MRISAETEDDTMRVQLPHHPSRDGAAVKSLHRRRFLAGLIGGGAALAAPSLASAAASRTLSFNNIHTGEKISSTYWADGRLIAGGCRQIDWILRDHRSGDIAAISPELFDLLFRLRQRLRIDAPFEVISGYRSPRTNAALRRTGGGVASGSLHMKGLAIDIRVPGLPLPQLHDAALKLEGGGVGYYPRSGFVHVDVGRVRSW